MSSQQRASEAWSAADRDNFWRFVRGRMAEVNLKQAQVADALSMDRTVLSRRLSGDIKTLPPLDTVAQLSQTLKLGEGERHRLMVLAGYEAPKEAAPSAAVDAADNPPALATEPSARRRRPLNRRPVRSGRATIGAVIVLTLVLTLGGALTVVLALPHTTVVTPTPGPATVSAADEPVPGGLWISPADGDTVSGPVRLAARAYSLRPTDPAIGLVLFTLSWEGLHGPWVVACRVTAPATFDTYTCLWDPAAAGVPPGTVQISFDVYDQAKPAAHVNMAPHGVRTMTYAPHAIGAAVLPESACAAEAVCPERTRVLMEQPACAAESKSITWRWASLKEASKYFLQVSTQATVNTDVAHSLAVADTFNNWINSTIAEYTQPAVPGITYYAIVNWTGPTKPRDGPASDVVSITCPPAAP